MRQVDTLAEALMPPGVRSLRSMLHATAVEVLLYLTPLHCQDMLGSLVAAMNAQFAKFMLRHPDFQARVQALLLITYPQLFCVYRWSDFARDEDMICTHSSACKPLCHQTCP
jgi:hypothetical protein